MKILLTDELSDALLEKPKEYVNFFIKRIDQVKDLNKTEFLSLESVVKLPKLDNYEMYAYPLEESSYILFASIPPKKLLLVDIVNVVNKETLQSLVFNKNIIGKDEQDT